ncbi:MAG: hypothetical protein ACUVV4_00930 [Candidatus Bathyarchaeia archaeon]
MKQNRGQMLIVSVIAITIALLTVSTVLSSAYLSGLNFRKSDFRDTATKLYYGSKGAIAMALADASKRLNQREKTDPPSPYYNRTELALTEKDKIEAMRMIHLFQNNSLKSHPMTGLVFNFSNIDLYCNWSNPQDRKGYSKAVADVSIDLLGYGFEGLTDHIVIEFNATLKSLQNTDGNSLSFTVEFLAENGYVLNRMSKDVLTLYFELYDYEATYPTLTKAEVDTLKFIGGIYLVNATLGFDTIDVNLDGIWNKTDEIPSEKFTEPGAKELLLNTITEIAEKYDLYHSGNRSQPWLQQAWSQLYGIRPKLDPTSPSSVVTSDTNTIDLLNLIDLTLAQLRPRVRLVAMDYRGITVSVYGELESVDLGPVILSEDLNRSPDGNYTLTAIADDTLTGDSEVSRVVYYISNSSTSIPYGSPAYNMTPVDLSFDEAIEAVNATVLQEDLYAGANYVWIRAQDAKGNWGEYAKLRLPSLLHLEVIDLAEMDAIEMVGKSQGSGWMAAYWVEATVKVADDQGNPVNGVTVQGRWWGSYSWTGTATPLGSGRYRFSTPARRYDQWPPSSGLKEFNIQITSLVKSGFEWHESPPQDWIGLTTGKTWVYKIPSTLSCYVDRSFATPGQSVIVSGSLEPDLVGKTITLTFRKPDNSVFNVTTVTGTSGAYSYSYAPSDTGYWSVTASWLGDDDYEASSSSATSFAVITVLLSDGFEGTPWNANWDATASSWTRASDHRHGGSYSAKSSDGHEGGFYSDPINTLGATSVTVRFWYRLDDTESNDLVLSYYNGVSWITIANLGGGSKNIWLEYTGIITDSQFFKTNFRIRFTSNLGSGENVWIDDVQIGRTP